MTLHHNEKLLLPILIVIFVINLHFYQWYDKSYVNAMSQLNAKPIPNRYERIQSEQHYYEIYQLSQRYKGKEDHVIFVQTNRGEEVLDYSSTYYANLDKPNDKKENIYLSELGLFIDYYFFPTYIPNRTIYDFADMKLQQDYVIISDKDLTIPELSHIPNTHLLTRVEQSPKNDALRVNRRPADPYYIFTVHSL